MCIRDRFYRRPGNRLYEFISSKVTQKYYNDNSVYAYWWYALSEGLMCKMKLSPGKCENVLASGDSQRGIYLTHSLLLMAPSEGSKCNKLYLLKII